jgi:hypothetical protein
MATSCRTKSSNRSAASASLNVKSSYETRAQNETPVEKAEVSRCKFASYLIPVVVAAVIIVPSAPIMVAMTPGPVILVIVMTMTWSDVHTTRSNLYADVGPRKSGLRDRCHTHEGNSSCAHEKCYCFSHANAPMLFRICSGLTSANLRGSVLID